MKKKNVVFADIFFLLCFCLFVSCAKKEAKAVVIPPDKTLRNEILKKYSSITWTEDLPPSPAPLVLYNEKNFPVPVSLPFISSPLPVYPALSGFGSLDISFLDPAAARFLNSFFSAAKNVSSVAEDLSVTEPLYASFFTPRKQYGARIFEYEISRLSPLQFWRYGKPFISETYTDVPVRLYCSDEIIDIHIFLEKNAETGSWSIDQIQFGAPLSE